MMVQFNLLPDIKLQYVRTRRTKYLMTFVSLVVGAVAITVFLLSVFMVNVVQKKSLSDLNDDIAAYSAQLKDVKDLSKILTVQNQLDSLTALHDGKPVTSRLFEYIGQLTPAGASLDKLGIDFEANTMTIGGKAPSLDTVSLYTDTLKATKFSVEGSTESNKAFSDVVLSTFGRDDKGATFVITLKYDPAIFQATNKVTLVVPGSVETDQTNVFESGN